MAEAAKCTEGMASVAGIREQEKKVSKNVNLTVLEEPGGLFSRAAWEKGQGLGDGNGSSDTTWLSVWYQGLGMNKWGPGSPAVAFVGRDRKKKQEGCCGREGAWGGWRRISFVRWRLAARRVLGVGSGRRLRGRVRQEVGELAGVEGRKRDISA